jgi:hypothetical protein
MTSSCAGWVHSWLIHIPSMEGHSVRLLLFRRLLPLGRAVSHVRARRCHSICDRQQRAEVCSDRTSKCDALLLPNACAPHEHRAATGHLNTAHVRRYDMTSAHWKRVSVSAFLRYEYYHPSIFRGIPGVVHRQGVCTPDAEEAILDSIVDLYYDRLPAEVRLLFLCTTSSHTGSAAPAASENVL